MSTQRAEMYFRILHDEPSGAMTYLLADAQAREAVLVDPHGRDLAVLHALLAEHDLRLRWVLRTHHHDHLHPPEAGLLAQLNAPLLQGAAQGRARCAADGDVLHFGREQVRVLATPGHTLHCLSFAWRDRLFCGDLLALQACPHQREPAQPALLWDSVTQRIFTLPDETLLFSGHGHHARAVSTVLEQRRWHPLLARLSRDAYLERLATLAPRPGRKTARHPHFHSL